MRGFGHSRASLGRTGAILHPTHRCKPVRDGNPARANPPGLGSRNKLTVARVARIEANKTKKAVAMPTSGNVGSPVLRFALPTM